MLLHCRMPDGDVLPVSHDVAYDVDGETETATQQTDSADDQINEGVHCGQYSEAIQHCRSILNLIVDVQDGLLGELLAQNVITYQQYHDISRQQTLSSRVDQLLDFLIQMPNAQQEQFLAALCNNRQTHVQVLLCAQGDLTRVKRDMWPVLCCDEWQMVEKNRAKLLELIDVNCGLLDELVAVGCISDRQIQTIRDGQTDADRNAILLNIWRCGSRGNLWKVFDCLIKTRQSTVVLLMSESYRCSDEPLSCEKKSLLESLHSKLIELIDSGYLLYKLMAADCFSPRQNQYIESALSPDDRNSRLLDILKRGSESDFNKFIECLSETGQKHVASILREDSVLMTADAVTNCSVPEQGCVVKKIMDVIRASLSSCSDAKRMNVYAEVAERLNELKSCDVRLIAATKKQNSIGLFYMCHSLGGLQHLCGLLSSRELKKLLERIFTLLLNSGKSVVVHSLRWDGYMKGWKCLYSKAHLHIFAELYSLPTNALLESCELRACSLRIDQLPSELVQLILNKAMGQLFVINHRVTPRAAVYAMATLSGVSMLWWWTITYRRYSKRVLKRYFQCVRSPFKCNPHRLRSLLIESVQCLTEFSGRLYVGVVNSASVQVFVSRPPFSRLDDIQVQGLNNPSDIVVCRDTSQLYITDSGNQYAIWRVDLLRNKQVDQFVRVQWQPYSLSVNSRRLLITPYDGFALFLYGDDGSQLNRIQLPDYMSALHAVETTHNTYIVCHRNRLARDTESQRNSVIEMNVDGRVVRTFNSQHIDIGSLQFNAPLYLALDDNNHVIVADRYNERVVVLKSDLQLKRVLLPLLDQQPMRLCLSEFTGLLFISYINSPAIDIYKVLS
jgi:hypothetical protein